MLLHVLVATMKYTVVGPYGYIRNMCCKARGYTTLQYTPPVSSQVGETSSTLVHLSWPYVRRTTLMYVPEYATTSAPLQYRTVCCTTSVCCTTCLK